MLQTATISGGFVAFYNTWLRFVTATVFDLSSLRSNITIMAVHDPARMAQTLQDGIRTLGHWIYLSVEPLSARERRVSGDHS